MEVPHPRALADPAWAGKSSMMFQGDQRGNLPSLSGDLASIISRYRISNGRAADTRAKRFLEEHPCAGGRIVGRVRGDVDGSKSFVEYCFATSLLLSFPQLQVFYNPSSYARTNYHTNNPWPINSYEIFGRVN